jgi:hypothetical protein
MRLRTSKISQISTEDGKATLTYDGITMHRDGGANYTLKAHVPPTSTRVVTLRVIIESNNRKGKISAAKQDGLDYSEMDIVEKQKFSESYFQKHPNREYVKEYTFDDSKLNRSSKISMRNIFVILYFRMNSSKLYNCSDTEMQNDKYYRDELQFLLFQNESSKDYIFFAPAESVND